MKYRNLKLVAESKLFLDFCEKYNLKSHIITNYIVLYNNNNFICFYSYLNEDVVYIDFYSIDLDYYANVDQLLDEMGIEDDHFRDKYLFYLRNIQGKLKNEEEKVIASIFTYLEILTKNQINFNDYLLPINPVYKENFKKILKELDI